MNSIEVKIAGQRFELRSDEDVGHIEQVAALVREKIERLSQAQPSMSPQKAAILAAFGFASERLRNDEKLSAIELRVQNLLNRLDQSPPSDGELEFSESQPELFEPRNAEFEVSV